MTIHEQRVPRCPPTLKVGGLDRGGHRIGLLPRCVFDLEDLAAGEQQSLVVARGVAVRGGDARLLVQLHRNDMGTSRVAMVRVRSEAPCADDPDLDFVSSTDAGVIEIDTDRGAGELVSCGLPRGLLYAVRAFVDLRNDSGSSTGGGTVELSADLFVRAGAASYKHRFVAFAYERDNRADLFYVPFRSADESPAIGGPQTLIATGGGYVEMVALWSNGNPGTTVVGVHLDGSTTASATASKPVTTQTVTNFFPTPVVKFAAGDRLSVSVDPTGFPDDVAGTVVLRMDEGG